MELKNNENKLNNDSMDKKIDDENVEKVNGGTFGHDEMIRRIEEIIDKSNSNK